MRAHEFNIYVFIAKTIKMETNPLIQIHQIQKNIRWYRKYYFIL